MMSIFEAEPIAAAATLVRVTVALSAIVCTCLLLQRLTARCSAAIHHALWIAVVALGLVLLPVAMVVPFRWGQPGQTRTPRMIELRLTDGGNDGELRTNATSSAPARMVLDESAAERVARGLIVVWLLGIVFKLVQLGSSAVRLQLMVRDARRLDPRLLADSNAGVAERVTIVESGAVSLPLATGLTRPFIILPAGAAHAWSQRRMRVALLHETAHIKRGDVFWHSLGRVCCALHWFNPLVWLAARRGAREAERACDDLVLRAGIRPSSYAGHLLEIARTAANPGHFATAVGQGSELEGRIGAVLSALRARRGLSRRALVAVAAGVALLAAGMGTHRRVLGHSAHAQRAQTVREPARETPQLAAALVQLLDDADPEVRAAAARSSGELRVRAAAPQLIAALEDPDASVRERAARSLGELEDAAAISHLQRVLLSDPSLNVRREAAQALGEMETGAAVNALRHAFDQVDDRGLRRTVIRALGETQSPAAIPLLERLIGTEDEGITRAALEALKQIDSPPATEALVAAMRSESAVIRRLAARAIAED